jgi:hypothetical protein
MIFSLKMLNPLPVSEQTEKMVQMLLRIRKGHVHVLIHPMEIRENTHVFIAHNERKSVVLGGGE